MIFSKLKVWGMAILGALTGVLWIIARMYRASRDKAREKIKRQKRELEQNEARMKQREKAAEADRRGLQDAREKRKEAREKAEQGKRDHFEGDWK